MGIPSLYPLDILSIPSRYPLDTLSIPSRYPLDTLSIPSLYPLYTLSIPSLYPLDTLSTYLNLNQLNLTQPNQSLSNPSKRCLSNPKLICAELSLFLLGLSEQINTTA